MTSRGVWTIVVFSYVALMGALLQMRGALLPSFGATFGATESQLGLVATVASLGFLVSVFAVGMSVGRIDVKRVLIGGLLALGVVLFVVGASPAFVVLLGGFLAAGFARGTLQALDRPILSHLYPERRGRIYNLQDMAWAAGATTGPVIAAVAIAVYDWRVAYYLVALACLPLAVVIWRLEMPTMETEQAIAVDGLRDLVRTPAIATMGALILLLSLVESGMFTWLPYYVGQTLPPEVASASLSVYLVAYVPGRYAFSRAAERADNLTLVFASGVLTTGALWLFLSVDGYAILAAVFLVGFLVAGMFPTLLAWATNTVPEYSGPVNALALGISSVGFMTFPYAMGVVAERYHIGLAMWLIVAAMGALTVVAAAIRSRKR